MCLSPLSVTCPNCGATVAWLPENRYRPFCSQRCRLIDLGAWAAADYSLPAEASPPAAFKNDDD